MPTLVDVPTLVQEALTVCGAVLVTDAARHHYAEYLTGLLVAEWHTDSGSNQACGLTTDLSCVHRWLTEVQGDVQALNDRRLAWLQQAPQTRYSVRGVIALDHTRVDHAGALLEDVGWYWEHADQRFVMAYDYIIANYVSPSGAHYPVEWRQFTKREACAGGECKDHTALCIELIDATLRRGVRGDFTLESSFTSADVLHHIQRTQRAYVGDVKLHRTVVYGGREQPLHEVARQVPWEAKMPVRMGRSRYWSFSTPMQLPDVEHLVQVLMFWRERDAPEARKALVSNRLGWGERRMVEVYRHRWAGTEPLHRDGTQQ
jgi:hypothetical protein